MTKTIVLTLLMAGIASGGVFSTSKNNMQGQPVTHYEIGANCFLCDQNAFKDNDCITTPTLSGRCQCTVPEDAEPGQGTPGSVEDGTLMPENCQQLWKRTAN